MILLLSTYDAVKILLEKLPCARLLQHIPNGIAIPRDQIKQLTTASDGGVLTIITQNGVIIDFYDFSYSTGKKEMQVVHGEEKTTVPLNDHVTVSLFERELWILF